MKTLYLLRHAKSSWQHPELTDHQRPLNNRGKRNAPEMARRFAARGEPLDAIISSTAVRALATARAFAAATGLTTAHFKESHELYFQGLQAFQQSIRAQSDDARSLLLVSHNPDLTAFANRLDNDLSIYNVPTAGLLCFECGIEHWQHCSPQCCRFIYHDYPKNPGKEPLTDPQRLN